MSDDRFTNLEDSLRGLAHLHRRVIERVDLARRMGVCRLCDNAKDQYCEVCHACSGCHDRRFCRQVAVAREAIRYAWKGAQRDPA